MNGRCHCGAVTITVPTPPAYLNLCNCSACFKLGAMWSYYPASTVNVVGETQAYARSDKADPNLHFHFCGRCGATTHWSFIEPAGRDRMGVNARLFEPAELAGIEVRYGERRTADQAAERTYREPSIFAASGAAA